MKNLFLAKGEMVHYTGGAKPENGIIKDIRNGNVFVVFNCAGNWENYENYTAQNCSAHKLKLGWVDSQGKLIKTNKKP